MKQAYPYSTVLISLLLISFSYLHGQTINQYRIIVDDNDLRTVEVEAQLQLDGSILSMDWPSGNSVENGWAHFADNLKVTDLQGKEIPFQAAGKATWQLSQVVEEVNIKYEVNIRHDKVNWTEGGHSAAAYVLEDVVYMIGAALFIAAPEEKLAIGSGNPAVVEFGIPDGFTVIVPWPKKDDCQACYQVGSTYELIRSGLSYGRLSNSVLDIQEMKIEIATASDFKASIPVFESMYEEIVPACLSYFGATRGNKYIVIANRAPRTEEYQPYFSAEALHQSMSVISPALPEEQFLTFFWYILAHEYIHTWNGINIRPKAEEAEYWFGEGFTDYVAWMLMYQQDKIPLELFLNGIELGDNGLGWGVNIKKYLAVAGKKTMREAGSDKQENYDLIYSGGSLFALILDIEMRMASQGRRGVKDLMRSLNQTYGTGPEVKLYAYQALVEEASAICGKDLSEIFRTYVEGISLIPVEQYLNKIGLTIKDMGQDSQHISIDQDEAAAAKQLREALLGQ